MQGACADTNGFPNHKLENENMILENELVENSESFWKIFMFFFIGIKMYSHNQICCNLEVENYPI